MAIKDIPLPLPPKWETRDEDFAPGYIKTHCKVCGNFPGPGGICETPIGFPRVPCDNFKANRREDKTMKKYIGTKMIMAEKATRGQCIAENNLGIMSREMYEQEGYKVVYSDGYESWSPKDVFEEAYRPIDGMTFGLAIEAMKKGKKVARQGWNGKGMFIVYMSPLYLPPYSTEDTNRKVNDRTAKWIGEDTPLDSQGYIAMFTAQKKWQPGWNASQADMLSEDWQIVE